MAFSREVTERITRIARHRATPIALGVLVILVYARRLAHAPHEIGPFDAQYFHFTWECARKTIVEFGQIPLWNPYHCGGVPVLANPQSMVWHPTFLLGLAFRTGPGLRLHLLVHLLVAFLGVFVLARHRGVRPGWAALAGLVFAMSGFFAVHGLLHPSLTPIAFVPLLLWLLEKAFDHLQWAWLAGAGLGLMVLGGSPYGVAFAFLTTTVALAVHSLERAIEDQRFEVRPLAIFATFGTAAFLLAAFKLLPILIHMGGNPRSVVAGHLHPGQMWDAFTDPGWERLRPEYIVPWTGHRLYVSTVVVVTAMLALPVRRVKLRDGILVAILLALMSGEWASWSPYALLRTLPMYEQLRVPARFGVLVVPFLAIWFAHVLQWLATERAPILERLPHSLRAGVAVVLGLLAIGLLHHHNQRLVPPGRFVPRPTPTAGATFHQHRNRNRQAQFRAPYENRGYLNCNEPAFRERSRALRAGPDVPQLHSVPVGTAELHLQRFSPNQIDLHVSLEEEAVVVVNQNYHAGWTASVGTVVERDGLLAVRLPATTGSVRLEFHAPGLIVGLPFAAAVVLVCLYLLFGESLRARLRNWRHNHGSESELST